MSILLAIGEGKHKPSHIALRVGLTWKRLYVLLKELVQQGMIFEENRQGRLTIRLEFYLSEEGKALADSFKIVERMLANREKSPK